ncbi:MAG: hypothetical protein IJR03_00165, partial [Bacteroidales bacterium]|nr:hypothetical protein [Bacteroidales bacterium]
MKEFSQETIEIDGVKYTLFLNRAGILAWEKYSKKDNEDLVKARDLYNKINEEKEVEIKEDTNPFEETDALLSSEQGMLMSYKKMFWILLYTNHKFSLEKAGELFDKACEEYGMQQVVALEDQMVNDANTDRVTNENVKK